MPISRELKNALERDLGWSGGLTRALIIFLPLLLIAAGLNNFLVVIELVGGVFLSLQYLLILAVGRRALRLPAAANFCLDAVSLVFLCAALYSIYTFIVK